jgi:hypothetical protein
MVDRSAKLPNSRVLFLPTLFWVSRHEEGYFDNTEVRPGSCPCWELAGGSCRGQVWLQRVPHFALNEAYNHYAL